MLRRTIVLALAFASIPAWAQSPAADPNAGQIVMQRLHDELTAQGYKDVTVVPSSFIVSGTNREGKPVMMLIGPNSMTCSRRPIPVTDRSRRSRPNRRTRTCRSGNDAGPVFPFVLPSPRANQAHASPAPPPGRRFRV